MRLICWQSLKQQSCNNRVMASHVSFAWKVHGLQSTEFRLLSCQYKLNSHTNDQQFTTILYMHTAMIPCKCRTRVQRKCIISTQRPPPSDVPMCDMCANARGIVGPVGSSIDHNWTSSAFATHAVQHRRIPVSLFTVKCVMNSSQQIDQAN